MDRKAARRERCRKVGDIVVTAISDGYLDAVYEFTRNITPQDAEQILKEAYRPAPPRVSVRLREERQR